MAGKKRDVVVAGSGNVFQDLGFTDSEERKLRVQLAVRLNELIDEHRIAQAAVAKRFGIPQPHVSELRNYKLGRFSSERIVRFITLPTVTSTSSSAPATHHTKQVTCRSCSPCDETSQAFLPRGTFLICWGIRRRVSPTAGKECPCPAAPFAGSNSLHGGRGRKTFEPRGRCRSRQP